MFSHQGPKSPTLSARVYSLSSLGGEDQSLRGQSCVETTTPASAPLPEGAEAVCVLPEGKYAAILADPPWRYACWGGANMGYNGVAEAHYKTMDADDIAAMPVPDLCADGVTVASRKEGA